MVQLHENRGELNAAGVQLAGISYDSKETLERFAKQSGVSFPLLSDKDSKVIDAYGVRNETAKGRFEGIPHPVTFVVDSEGTIRAKLGRERYQDRHEVEELIRAVEDLKKP